MTLARTACLLAAFLATSACSASSDRGASHSTTAVAAVDAIPSAGCSAVPSPSVISQNDVLRVGGRNRHYLLTTPAASARAKPLVMEFHGYGEGTPTASLATQFGALGEKDGFITVFPSGTGSPVSWNTSSEPGNPDLKFVAALLDHLEATQCVDETRVYATGLSQGAFMSSTLACAMSDRFAAVAPVAGVELPKPCHTTRPVPILAFHGTQDPILGFNGGVDATVLTNDLSRNPGPLPTEPKARLNGKGYPAHVREWAAKNGCGSTPTDTKPSPHIIHRVYPCPPGTAVEFDIIIDGGHTWPGSSLDKNLVRFMGPTTFELDATTTIWAFFRQFHLPPDEVGG